MNWFTANENVDFRRLNNGDVALRIDQKVITIDAGTWGSVVLSMTKFSERPNDWHEFMAHHNGIRDMLAAEKKLS